MNRAERRQIRLGRAPAIVALPSMKGKRVRKVTAATKRCQDFVTIDNGRSIEGMGPHPEDTKFIADQMTEFYVRTGNTPLMLDPTAPVLFARHKITGRPLAAVTFKPIPPGKIYVENLLCENSRAGKIAVRALCERLMEAPPKKVCLVGAGNQQMLSVLEHYGGRVVALIVEGPFDGAPEVAVAAAPMEAVS